jgi:protein TonB
MKIMNIILLIFFLCILTAPAQEKEADQLPEPVGGIAAIAQNIVYPQSAKENKVEGKVIIHAVIDRSGNVTSISVEKSLNPECDKAAADAIKVTKFKPGIKNGETVVSEVSIPIMFKLS